MQADPLSFGFTIAGYMHRYATNERFSEWLSYFSDGKAYFNNVSGLVAGNTVTATWRGIRLSCGLGQWNSGREYRKQDTLLLSTPNDTYALFYDSLAGIEPTIIIPSTSVALGLHYTIKWLDVGYSIGYQWEDIIFADLVRQGDGALTLVKFDNDWWFHRLYTDMNIDIDAPFTPVAYAHFTFPFISPNRCGWHMIELGLKVKLTPRQRRTDSPPGREDRE
jgi:hypothetical protein